MTEPSQPDTDSSTHTPGRLRITGPSPGLDRGIDDGGDYVIVDVNGHVIGQAHRLVAPGVVVPAKANATLWAAAPQLLKALEAAEWGAGPAAGQRTCPVCLRGNERDGHDPDCELHTAIEEATS